MTFTVMSSRPRTNDSFRSGRDRQHHNEPTPLLRQRMDIIKCFPIDYMHLTVLGTFKQYLRIILQGNVSEEDRIHKLSNHLI
jgi:hypothetical protein